MKTSEFMALKEGDEIYGMNGAIGTIDRAEESRGVKIVHVRWSEGGPTFAFSSNQTAWMHWTKCDGGDDEKGLSE